MMGMPNPRTRCFGLYYINSTFGIQIQGTPSGCGWLEIPWVLQVPKGEHHHQTSRIYSHYCFFFAASDTVCQDEVRRCVCVCMILKLYVDIIIPPHCCCCNCGCAVTFEIRRNCRSKSPLPCAASLRLSWDYVFVPMRNITRTNTHRCTVRGRHKGNSLMYDRRCAVSRLPQRRELESLRDAWYRHDTAMIQTWYRHDTDMMQTWYRHDTAAAAENVGFPLSWDALWLGGKESRDYVPVHATLSAKARAAEPDRAPHLALIVYRRPPCMLRSQEREERPAAGKEKVDNMKKRWIRYVHILCLLKTKMWSYQLNKTRFVIGYRFRCLAIVMW